MKKTFIAVTIILGSTVFCAAQNSGGGGVVGGDYGSPSRYGNRSSAITEPSPRGLYLFGGANFDMFSNHYSYRGTDYRFSNSIPGGNFSLGYKFFKKSRLENLVQAGCDFNFLDFSAGSDGNGNINLNLGILVGPAIAFNIHQTHFIYATFQTGLKYMNMFFGSNDNYIHVTDPTNYYTITYYPAYYNYSIEIPFQFKVEYVYKRFMVGAVITDNINVGLRGGAYSDEIISSNGDESGYQGGGIISKHIQVVAPIIGVKF